MMLNKLRNDPKKFLSASMISRGEASVTKETHIQKKFFFGSKNRHKLLRVLFDIEQKQKKKKKMNDFGFKR